MPCERTWNTQRQTHTWSNILPSFAGLMFPECFCFGKILDPLVKEIFFSWKSISMMGTHLNPVCHLRKYIFSARLFLVSLLLWHAKRRKFLFSVSICLTTSAQDTGQEHPYVRRYRGFLSLDRAQIITKDKDTLSLLHINKNNIDPWWLIEDSTTSYKIIIQYTLLLFRFRRLIDLHWNIDSACIDNSDKGINWHRGYKNLKCSVLAVGVGK